MENSMALRLSVGIATLAAIAALAATPCVHAQAQGSFDEADANKDGHVTLQEFAAYNTKRLMAGSGRLARRFQQLTPEQQSARLEQRFQKLDRDHKGYLDRSDWKGR
jgi:Ca2+-binding EF-hand superfamily protein